MPTIAIRELTARERTNRANRRLGALLAFVGGAVNAAGLILIGRYTSHMTGIVSTLSEDVAFGRTQLAAVGLALVVAFTAGAAVTAVLVNLARRHHWVGEYAPSIALESALLFAIVIAAGRGVGPGESVVAVGLVLCFMMGLQNALITKVSRAEIRTTHVTGIVTDIGIELGRALVRPALHAGGQPNRLATHLLILACFFVGGIAGAIGMMRFGAASILVPAVVLGAISLPSVARDVLGSGRTR